MGNQTVVSRRHILAWNSFGVLDFIIALSLGVMTRTEGPLQVSQAVSSDILVSFPFVIIPGYLVQLLLISHIIIYLQCMRRH
jgi:hypothetical protein